MKSQQALSITRKAIDDYTTVALKEATIKKYVQDQGA